MSNQTLTEIFAHLESGGLIAHIDSGQVNRYSLQDLQNLQSIASWVVSLPQEWTLEKKGIYD